MALRCQSTKLYLQLPSHTHPPSWVTLRLSPSDQLPSLGSPSPLTPVTEAHPSLLRGTLQLDHCASRGAAGGAAGLLAALHPARRPTPPALRGKSPEAEG